MPAIAMNAVVSIPPSVSTATRAVPVEMGTCTMTPTDAAVEEIPIIQSLEIMFTSTVTDTYCTVRQQAP